MHKTKIPSPESTDYSLCVKCQSRIYLTKRGNYVRKIGALIQLCCPQDNCGWVDWYPETEVQHEPPVAEPPVAQSKDKLKQMPTRTIVS
jgi:hypothetical protein